MYMPRINPFTLLDNEVLHTGTSHMYMNMCMIVVCTCTCTGTCKFYMHVHVACLCCSPRPCTFIENHTLKNIHTLRTAADANAIADLGKDKDVLIIGTSFIGTYAHAHDRSLTDVIATHRLQ